MRDTPRWHMGEPRQSVVARSSSRSKWVTVITPIVILLALLLLLAFFSGAITFNNTNNAISPVQAPNMSQGVHVCLPNAYDSVALLCKKDIDTLTMHQANLAMFSFTGPGGGAFTSPTSNVIVSTFGAGGWKVAGQWQQATGLTYGVMSETLNDVLVQAGASVTPGSYHVEVDNGNTLVGAADFSLS